MEDSTEITSKLDEISDALRRVKEECEKLRRELSKGASSKEEVQLKLAEINYILEDEFIEEILFEIKALEAYAEEIVSQDIMATELIDSCSETDDVIDTKMETAFLEETEELEMDSKPKYPIVDTVFTTRDKWELFWNENFQQMKNRLITLNDGTSYENMAAKNPSCVCLELGNYSSLKLKKGHSISHDSAQGELPNEVSPKTKDFGILCSSDSNELGVYSYEVATAGVSLVLRVENNPKKCELNFGFALLPMKIPIGRKLLKEQPMLPTAYFNFKRDGQFKIVQYKDLLATANYNRSTKVLYVEMIQADLEFLSPPSNILGMKSVIDGYTWQDYTSINSLFSEEDRVGCIVEFENRLNTDLVDFKYYIPSANRCVLLPPETPNFVRNMLVVSDASIVNGIFSYLIHGTDLRVAIVFGVHPQSNYFSIGFISSQSATDKSTLNFLSGLHQQIGPYVLSTARNVDQILEYRQLRVTASMTEDSKAIMKVVITAY